MRAMASTTFTFVALLRLGLRLAPEAEVSGTRSALDYTSVQSLFRRQIKDAMFRSAASVRARLVTTNLILAQVHRFLLFHAGIEPAVNALGRIQASRMVSVT